MKKLIFLLISTLLLACACAIPATLMNGTPKPSAPTLTRLDLGPTEVQLHPGGGDLLKQLQAQAPQAAALGQHMFVEFDAAW